MPTPPPTAESAAPNETPALVTWSFMGSMPGSRVVAVVGALVVLFTTYVAFVWVRNRPQKKGALSTQELLNEDAEQRPPIQTPEQSPGSDNMSIGASSTSQMQRSSIGHEREPVRDDHVLVDVVNDDQLNDAQLMVADEGTIDDVADKVTSDDLARTIQEAPIIPSDEGRKAATEHTPGFLERFLPTVHSCRPCAPCGQAAPVEVTITSP